MPITSFGECCVPSHSDQIPWGDSCTGSLADHVSQYQEDDFLIAAPSSLSYEELAALPGAAGTAANALFFGRTEFRRGMTVLTQGTGGVSSAAIQVSTLQLIISARDF